MNFFSSSTSHLVIPCWNRCNTLAKSEDDLSTTKYASTEGRFSIIDERRKESTSVNSSDSSSDSEIDFKETAPTKSKYESPLSSTILPLSLQQEQPQLKGRPINGTRFRIVHVDTRYKRDRWTCWDFYDSEPAMTLRNCCTVSIPVFNKISKNLKIKSLGSTTKTSMCLGNDNAQLTAPPTHQPPPVSFSFDFFDEFNAENQSSVEENKTICLSTNDVKGQNKLKPLSTMETEQQSLGGRMTPVELLQNFGLERSLSVTYNDNRSILELLPGTIPPAGSPRMQTEGDETESTLGGAATGSGAGVNTPIVAIDSKIEQAMDLVKTHLMFAVREEVEVLRAKIMELEATILQLEAENGILREHVPADILNKLSSQTVSSNSTAAATV